MKDLSLFTHPKVVPNVYAFLSSAEHTKKIDISIEIHTGLEQLDRIFICG